MAGVGEEFPLVCPTCGGDIRSIAFITEPVPIRKILTHLGEPLISRAMLENEPLIGRSLIHAQSSHITPPYGNPLLTVSNPPLRLRRR